MPAPPFRLARALAAAAVVAATLAVTACGGGSGTTPLDDATLRASDPAAIGQRLLDRFAGTIELQEPSVDVVTRGGTPYALRFDYFTPLGDKSFLVHLERDGSDWVADRGDVLDAERRLGR
jgi:hypothetical protein